MPRRGRDLFFVILFTLIYGSALALRFEVRRGDLVGWTGVAVLVAVAAYFAGCLRLGEFREWHFNADTKQVYWAADYTSHHCGMRKFTTQWMYPGVLNFYKRTYDNHSLEFPSPDPSKPLPTDNAAYVLHYPEFADFIKAQKLKLVFRSDQTHTVLAVRACEAETVNGAGNGAGQP